MLCRRSDFGARAQLIREGHEGATHMYTQTCYSLVRGENSPAVANVYHSEGEVLKGKKTNELIKNSQSETVISVPKPVSGEKFARMGLER